MQVKEEALRVTRAARETFSDEQKKVVQEFQQRTDESTPVLQLQEGGHVRTAGAFSQVGSACSQLIALDWVPPVTQSVQASCGPPNTNILMRCLVSKCPCPEGFCLLVNG